MDWISTKDKLPEHLQRIVFISEGEEEVGIYCNNNPSYPFWGKDAAHPMDCVKYWYPIPQKIPLDG